MFTERTYSKSRDYDHYYCYFLILQRFGGRNTTQAHLCSVWLGAECFPGVQPKQSYATECRSLPNKAAATLHLCFTMSFVYLGHLFASTDQFSLNYDLVFDLSRCNIIF